MIFRTIRIFILILIVLGLDYRFQLEISRHDKLTAAEYYTTLSKRFIKLKLALTGKGETPVKTINGGSIIPAQNEPGVGELFGVRWGDSRGDAVNETGDALGRRVRRLRENVREAEDPSSQD